MPGSATIAVISGLRKCNWIRSENMMMKKQIHFLNGLIILSKDKGNKKGDLIQGPLFPSFIHTNKQLFPNILTGSQPQRPKPSPYHSFYRFCSLITSAFPLSHYDRLLPFPLHYYNRSSCKSIQIIRDEKMALSEYLHEMPLNRIICRKKVIKWAKKVFTRFYIIRRGCAKSQQ